MHTNEFEEVKQKKIAFAFSTFPKQVESKHIHIKKHFCMVSFALISMLALIITSYSKDYSNREYEWKRFLETLILLHLMSGLPTCTHMTKTMHNWTISKCLTDCLPLEISKRWATQHEKGSYFLSVTKQARFLSFSIYIRVNCVYATPSNATNKRFYVVKFLWIGSFGGAQDIRISGKHL